MKMKKGFFMDCVDLHVHTTASDGTYSPEEVVKLAKQEGLRAIAITDHDTVKGLKEASLAGEKYGVEVIPGCELSVEYPHGQMHIVGLWISKDPKFVAAELQFLRDKRHSRNKDIIKKLQNLGIDITYEEVLEIVKNGTTVGRPHIARVLVKKGVVKDINEAFTKYIGPNGLAYVPKTKFSPKKAIDIIKKEGGLVILAHPYSLNLGPDALKDELIRLKGFGLDGMEVYYSEHTPEQERLYLNLCKELGLLISGGSDFHGSVKKGIFLGKGKGNLKIPYALVEKMKEYRRQKGLGI